MTQLVDTLTRKEDWAALIRVYEDTLRTKPLQDVEAGILIQIGMIYDQKLLQPDKAEENFRRVRKFSPTQPTMLEFYRRYYREKGEPKKLLALLDAAQRVESDQDNRITLAKEMAVVAEEEVGNLDKAIDIWKGIQRLDPTVKDATAALKNLYRASTPPKWNALRELLKDELESLGDDQVQEKIGLLMDVVEIYRDNLKLDVMVINTYNSILELQPDHQEALDALTDKYESMGRWNDLIGLLLKQKDVQTDAAEQVEILHRVAGLWVDKFGNQSQAIKPLEEILELEPTEETALEKLRAIHTKRRNWRELMELNRKEAAHRDGDEARRLYIEVAELAAKKLGDNREGIQVWNQILEQDPADPEALDQLAALYSKEDRWPALAEILHRQVEQAGDDADRSLELLQKLGDIYTKRLDAVDSAIEVWQEVLRLQPESAKAKKVLRDLFVRQQRWEDLEQLFESQQEIRTLAETLGVAADAAEEMELKGQLYTRVGEIYRDRLGMPAKAMDVYERVMTIDPDNVEVAGALVPLYRDGEKWARLLDVNEVLLKHADARDEKLALLAEICRLCEENLQSPNMAFSWCAKAFAMDVENPDQWEELERLADVSGEWEDLVSLYTDHVGEIEDPNTRTALLRKLATLSEERLDRSDDAEVFYRDILEMHPEDLQALESLERLYTEGQQWISLVEIHQRRVEMEDTVEGKVERLFQVAAIQEEELADVEAAVEALKALTELDTNNFQAVKSLGRLYLLQEQWPELVETLGRELELVDGASARVEVLFRLGEIHHGELEEHGRAIEFFAQVLSLDDMHKDSVSALKTISVIDPANVDWLGESLEHLLGLGLRHLSFNLNYEGDWNEANRTRFEKAIDDMGDAYIAAYRKGFAFKVNLFDAKIITHVKGGYACGDRCDFGCDELAVSPSGKLYPCDRLIGEDDRDDVVIGDVWKGVDLMARKKLIDSKNEVKDDCEDCEAQGRCMHWCGCVNYAMTGSVGGVSGLLCWFEQTVIDAADRAAQTLYAERNPGFVKRFYSHVLK